MRIVHVVPALFSREGGILGGAERYAFELARAMSRRAETCLLTFGPRSEQYREDDLSVRVIRLPWFVRGNRHNPISLRAIPELLRADVIHIHQRHVLVATAAGLLGKLTGKPVFVTDLGGGAWDLSGYVNTDALFAGHLHISEYSRRASGHRDLARARVILGGVDLAKFKPGPGGRGVLFVGRLLPHKGIDFLIRGLPEHLALRVVGTTYSQEYRALLARLGSSKKVEFFEAVSERELAGFYAEADVIVLPSVYEDCYGGQTLVPELLGQTLLEGMAAGLPAICTSVASLPEVVIDGVTGYVVPPNDPAAIGGALERLFSRRALRLGLGRAGRDRVVTVFSWQRTVDRCLEAYEALG
jgi:glycosyltransferase involved in cell wall biosynthesis